MAGRKTKLTPDVQARILDAIRDGNYFQAAAGAGGITPRCLYIWLKRGEEEESGLYHDFQAAVQEAEASAERQMVSLWQSQTAEDWRAAMTFLQRRWPERWAERNKLEIKQEERKEKIKLQFDFSELPQEVLKMLAEEPLALEEGDLK